MFSQSPKQAMKTLGVFVIFGILFGTSLAQELQLTYNLSEEQPSETFLCNVGRDSLLYVNLTDDVFQRLKFDFFTPGNPHTAYFTINNNSSTIRTSQKIDREAVCPQQRECVLSLDVAVYLQDGASFDLYKLVRVKVFIEDINDNTPVFPVPSISLSVPESVPEGYQLMTSGATDLDTGYNNSIQEYVMEPANGMFGLKVLSGLDGAQDLAIVVNYRLDRETRDFFQVKIIAKDGGYPQRSGTVEVNITVTDINDNKPVFVNQTFTAQVGENVAPGTKILQVVAVDQDAGDNGRISYRFNARTGPRIRQLLRIDENTGDIIANGTIDYESPTPDAGTPIQFFVDAMDHGSPVQTSQATVVINVIDVNDNAPVININLSPGGLSLSEGEEPGKAIAYVSVSDADSGDNKKVTCEITNDTHFRLDPFLENVDKVVLARKLDYEAGATHGVLVTCRDGGQPPLSSSSALTVTVLDENDNSPEFPNSIYRGQVEENAPRGVVMSVTAVDRDGPANNVITYSLDPSVQAYLSIDSKTGEIWTVTSLDREETPVLAFNVIARDSGTPQRTSSVSAFIDVVDTNDNSPRFTTPMNFAVSEGLDPGSVAANLSAPDRDSDLNARKIFTFLPGFSDSQYFRLEESTGRVLTQVKFDRESRDKYVFGVKVQDRGNADFTDTANVTISILDVNDNPPEIEFPSLSNNSVTVPFETSVGVVIAVVTAHDDDIGDSAMLSFTILKGNSRNLFSINRVNGEVAVSRRILPDDVEKYSLEIAVSDAGTPSLTSRAELNVVVMAGNWTEFWTQKDSHDQNVLIVIILVVVTVVLALAILITICMIKRIDRSRSQGGRSPAGKTDEAKMFQVMKSQSLSSVSKDSNENEADRMKSKGRKEVSFSLDESGDHVTSHHGGTENGHVTNFQTSLQSHAEMEPTGGLVLTNASLLGDSGGHVSPPPPHAPPPSRHWSADQGGVGEGRKAEDAMSETSGETGTSDSGRGNSEDEINSNKSAVPESGDGRPAGMTRLGGVMEPGNHANASFRRQTEPRQSNHSVTFQPGHAHRPFSPSHAPLGGQATPTPGHAHSGGLGYGREYTPYRDSGCFSRPPSDPQQRPEGRGQYQSEYMPMDKGRYSMRGGADHIPLGGMGYPPNVHHHHQQQHPHLHPQQLQQLDYSSRPLEFVPGQSWRAATPSYRDDDEVTTTSGSYTISPDDLRQDMDDLYYRDAVV